MFVINYRVADYEVGMIALDPVRWVMNSNKPMCFKLYRRVFINADNPFDLISDFIRVLEFGFDSGVELVGTTKGFNMNTGKMEYYKQSDIERVDWFIDWLERKIK